jgi:hypothetical protein
MPAAVRSGLVLMLALAVLACAPKVVRRSLHDPADLAALDQNSPYLKAHLPDGGLYILSDWRVDESARRLAGAGVFLDARRDTLDRGLFDLAVDEVAIFESNVLQISPALAPLTVVTGLSLALTIYCLNNPKACFGSCPTFHTGDGPLLLLQAEGFSASVAPALERTDLDALYRTVDPGPTLAVTVTNEALETHVIRHADLLVAPRPPDGRVLATTDDRLFRVLSLEPPRSGRGPEGDCTDLLRRFDGRERTSLADSVDLAARETLDLVFDPSTGDSLGLVVASRQSLLSTYLFYQGLAYLGEQAVPLLARIGPERAFDPDTPSVGNLLGRIEVSVPAAGGGWRRVGAVGETGPLAVNVHLLPLGTDDLAGGRVRLRLTRGQWRLDWVALARLDGEVAPVRCAPVAVERSGRPDPAALADLTDPRRTLVTFPGDRLVLHYELPATVPRPEVFLESRGYYLEWMRQAWLDEEDAGQAALMLRRPDLALRLLAPEFKALEPGMEEAFWGSRYAP